MCRVGEGRGATKLRIHNSFIWPYLHIFSALRRRKKRAEIGIWLAFVANILAYAAALPFSTSPLPQYRSTLPWLQSYSGPGRGRSFLAKAFIKFKSCYRRK